MTGRALTAGFSPHVERRQFANTAGQAGADGLLLFPLYTIKSSCYLHL